MAVEYKRAVNFYPKSSSLQSSFDILGKESSTLLKMKFIIALCLFGVALALPQQDVIKIIRSESQPPSEGSFRYEFETEDGIIVSQEGSPGSAGQSNFIGSFSFTFPDGTAADFKYVADEEGYKVESPLLPVAPPIPEHALAQIAFAEEQKQKGVTFE